MILKNNESVDMHTINTHDTILVGTLKSIKELHPIEWVQNSNRKNILAFSHTTSMSKVDSIILPQMKSNSTTNILSFYDATNKQFCHKA